MPPGSPSPGGTDRSRRWWRQSRSSGRSSSSDSGENESRNRDRNWKRFNNKERDRCRAFFSSQESTGQIRHQARSSSQENTEKRSSRSRSQDYTQRNRHQARNRSPENTEKRRHRARSSSTDNPEKRRHRDRSSSPEKRRHKARSSSPENTEQRRHRARSSSPKNPEKRRHSDRSSSTEKRRHRARSSSPKNTEQRRHRARSSSPKNTEQRRHRARSSSPENTEQRRHSDRSSSPEKRRHRARSSSPENTEQRRHSDRSSSPEKRRHRARSSSPKNPEQRRHSDRSSSPEKRRHRARSSSPENTEQRRHRARSSSPENTEQRRHRARSSSQNGPGRKRRGHKKSRSNSGARRKARGDRDKKRQKNVQLSSESEQEVHCKARNRERRTSRSRCSVSSVSSLSPARSQSPEDGANGGLSLQELLKQKEEKKKQMEMMKAIETPEEKRARRLAKKEAKERKKREKMGWGEEYMGYTNTDNPFGDNNLLGTFIWSKALEKKGIGHLTEKDLKDRNKHIQEDNRLELQKVKQLRLEREREKAMREQELEMLQREKEAEHFKTWEEQEDNFHLHQAKLRSKIRIRDGRAKPIDLLAKYISAEDDDLAVEMHEPYTFLTGLTVSDLDDLLEDIQIYMELEQGKNVDFWRDMTTITEDEISKLRKLETSGKGPGERREGVNASVSTDVQAVFKGKTYSQLQVISQGIESRIRAGGPNLDIGYWESLLQQLRAYMARARLRERHQDVLRQKLFKLKQEQGVESEPLFPIIKQERESPNDRPVNNEPMSGEPGTSTSATVTEETVSAPEGEVKDGGGESVLMEEDLIQQSLNDYDAGRYSPKLLTNQELPFDAHVVDFEEDQQRLVLCRQQLQVTGDASESPEDIFIRKAKEGMDGDEAQFSVEIPVTSKAYLWADKYRPRKPRFFNRVHTGFEWNKYNQTHYDFDNPPPKIVQGYKFNIFYPDLINKRSTPEYFLEACHDNKDFAILRFHAGPPYEDIAFKIVNREWEYSHRHGFRCQFSNGIFQLWFHFKRYRYRR
ncbi:splicing factor Cactin [Mixophyes fleayi]|uniref:splicing factor Cactin n=1 Tax=Mixophyes fleayi TaxID=3061075 RepID=UPI003F4DE350